MDGFQAYIDHFFSDDQGRMVVLSTVHKAKGLEEERVFILKPEIMPHPKARMGWQLEQEYNLKYVAYSRSKGEMFFVQDAAPSGVSHTPFRTAVTS
jgi:DNA helicase II / ATP-dependent DNA helicase PcrA